MEKIILEYLIHIKALFLSVFLSSENRTYIPWLGTSIIIGFGVFFYWDVIKGKKKWDDYFSYLLPKKIYFHPSAIMDYKLIIINILLAPSNKILGFLSTGFLSQFTYNFLKGIYIPTWSRWETNYITIFLAGLFGLLVFDFSSFITHYWAHKNKYLWRIHSLHHSAEVMTPITNTRNHPLWGIYVEVIKSTLTAIFYGFFAYITINGLDIKFFMGFSFAITIFYAAASNLRHSHIWLSYGKFLSHFFVSPAMHQIHHSLDMKHRNKNMGLIFSIWDWIFGTLYIPKEKEELRFGISKENPNPHKTLKDALITSIIKG